MLLRRDQRCQDQDQAKNESPIDFVLSSRPKSRPRQGKSKIKTDLDPNIATINIWISMRLPATINVKIMSKVYGVF